MRGRRIPTATYRLQLTPDFGFDAAAAVAPYLADLGVSHLYCSPWLQAAPGSTHGYDVVDHRAVNAELGGPPGLALLVAACREHGLGIVMDVVPNHVHVGVPERANAAWWDLLRRGPASPFASWFDVDWDAPGLDRKVLVPVLGGDLAVVLANGELIVDDGVIRYGQHVFPIAAGTGDLPLAEMLAAQHYLLAHWRQAADRLNYRRFFDVTTLAGVRVEDPEVFGATHALLVRQNRDRIIDGLRIDHPDGLADPAGYLDRLAAATDDAWVVVEKILEGEEQLPTEWRCAGTTGYDALNAILGLLVDTAAEAAFTDMYATFTGAPTDWNAVEDEAKRDAVGRGLHPEIARLARVIAPKVDEPIERIETALAELLVAMPVYRAYVRPAEGVPERSRAIVMRAAEIAANRRPDLARLLAALAELVLTGPAEVVIRFQQTCGPVMAKGLEDTAFYRYHRLVALNEVGGDPGRFGRSIDDFHEFCRRLAQQWPASMTTLSTHDTKRSEDVRARLAVLTEIPDEWRDAVSTWSAAAAAYRSSVGPDPNTEYLLWQTLVGAWPLTVDRAVAYAQKATREAKQRTAWIDGDPRFDDAVRGFVEGVLSDDALTARIGRLVEGIAAAATANSLSQKLVQLTMPGVPDVYQGTESPAFSLVDPDNRRPVDYDRRRQDLAAAGADPKLRLVRAALVARRDHPEWYGAGAAYEPLHARGSAASHMVGFVRGGGAVTVATRLSVRLERAGGWAETVVALPDGQWTDLLTTTTIPGGRDVPVSDILSTSAVALLGRTDPNDS